MILLPTLVLQPTLPRHGHRVGRRRRERLIEVSQIQNTTDALSISHELLSQILVVLFGTSDLMGWFTGMKLSFKNRGRHRDLLRPSRHSRPACSRCWPMRRGCPFSRTEEPPENVLIRWDTGPAHFLTCTKIKMALLCCDLSVENYCNPWENSP